MFFRASYLTPLALTAFFALAGSVAKVSATQCSTGYDEGPLLTFCNEGEVCCASSAHSATG